MIFQGFYNSYAKTRYRDDMIDHLITHEEFLPSLSFLLSSLFIRPMSVCLSHCLSLSVFLSVSHSLSQDPVNEAVVTMLQEASNPVVSLVFREKEGAKKGSSMMTISAGHRESLAKLMTNLMSTHPHFVRSVMHSYSSL